MNHSRSTLRALTRFIGRRFLFAGNLAAVCAAVGIFAIEPVFAADPPAMKRMQTVTLTAGWNAVYLEVEPMNVSPAKVFEGKPVDIVAAWFPPEASTQFVTNPGTQLFKGLGWGVWYAENRPDAFLRSLNAIYGQQAYLIHTTQAFEWRVDGLVSMGRAKWQPDSYNLTGFSVVAQGSPTFEEFFSASPALRGQPIYRLVNDVWKKVSDPAAETMRSGEAFWIYCKGSSDYKGPLTVETGAVDGLLVLEDSGAIIVRNHTDHPVTPLLEHVAIDEKPVPLSINVRVLGDLEKPVRSMAAAKPAGAWRQTMPPMEARTRLGIPFTARCAEMSAFEQVSLLKITTDMGTELWVPVLGRRPDLKKN